MADRTFKILDEHGKEVGEQTLDERFTPLLQPGQRAVPALTKEEAKIVAATEKVIAKEEAAAAKNADKTGRSE